jgi:hypothetical protein
MSDCRYYAYNDILLDCETGEHITLDVNKSGNIADELNVIEFPFTIKNGRGNILYRELSNGSWSKYQYNTRGKKIYYEDSAGYWGKQEYDANGYVIYHENSSGYWFKQEFDAYGNNIYYEDTNDVLMDKRPKP